MPDPTYTITLTESERTALAAALGTFVSKLTNCRVQLEAPGNGTPRAPLSPSTAPPAVAAAPAPIVQRDRWAKDRKGNELANPEGCYPADVYLWKTEQTPKWLSVAWQTSTGQGHGDAKCFDRDLWPWILQSKAIGDRVRLYILRKGNYSNIVGIRA